MTSPQVSPKALPKQYYPQKFRKSWQLNPEYRDWLRPVLGNSLKAQCIACNAVFCAKISYIKKHNEAINHKQKLLVFAPVKQDYDDYGYDQPEEHVQESQVPNPSIVLNPMPAQNAGTVEEAPYYITHHEQNAQYEQNGSNGSMHPPENIEGCQLIVMENMAVPQEQMEHQVTTQPKIVDVKQPLKIHVQTKSPGGRAVEYPASYNDDSQAFGNYVARELRNIKDKKICQLVKLKFLQILYEAEVGTLTC